MLLEWVAFGAGTGCQGKQTGYGSCWPGAKKPTNWQKKKSEKTDSINSVKITEKKKNLKPGINMWGNNYTE